MIIDNFVDDAIPDWQMKPKDMHRVRITSTVIYRLPLSPSEFERQVKALPRRRKAFQDAIEANIVGQNKPHLVTSASIEDARNSTNERMGKNYVDQFIYDTERSVIGELNMVVRKCRESDISVFPSHASDAITAAPARSFSTVDDQSAYTPKQANKKWVPTIRLTAVIEVEGQRECVESVVSEFRNAMQFCGPVTTFNEQSLCSRQQESVPRHLHLISEAGLPTSLHA